MSFLVGLGSKELKKRLKLITPQKKSDDDCNRPAKRPRVSCQECTIVACVGEMSREVVDFVELLEQEVEKFNSFFVEKEEEYIITPNVLNKGNWNYFAAIRYEKRDRKLEATHLEKAKELYTKTRSKLL